MYEDRVKWIEHKGKRVLSLDYSNLEFDKIPGMAEEVKKTIKKEPLNSVLYVTNAENLKFSMNVLSFFNKLAEETKPWDKGVTMLGVKGLVKVMYDGYAKLFTKPIKTFDDMEKALDWAATL